jgi:mono/diheme cytochrome c family protein
MLGDLQRVFFTPGGAMKMPSGKWGALVVAVSLTLVLGASEARAQAQAPAPDGAAIYAQNCRMCHGARGVPAARMVQMYPGLKTLADSGFMAKLSEDSIAAVVKKGAGKFMMPFGQKLSAAEVTAVAKFVKTLPSAPHAP